MIFYDYEVFQEDWLVVFVDLIKEEEYVYVNQPEALQQFHNEHRNRIFTGFNNKHYDQWIHKAILMGFNPKEMNNWIIVEGKSPWRFNKDLNKIHMNNYDVMERIDRGLKVFEGFMGHDIKESSVPFDLDRKLTQEELAETYDYCRHDVYETIEIFLHRQNDFKAHFDLAKLAGNGNLRSVNFNRSRGNLSAHMLGAKKVERKDEFDLILPDTLRLNKYKHVADWYMKEENKKYQIEHPDKKPTKNSLKIDVAGVPHVFAWGGLHGAREQYHDKGHYVLVDVGSMYPSLILEYGLLSRNCKDRAYDTYENIYETRLRLKVEGKKQEQEPLKLFLNSTYGIMKDKNNAMYDPLMANTVCVYGQLFLLDLIEKLEAGFELIQSNTDGILVKMENKDDLPWLQRICSEWEDRVGLNLDYEFYKEVWQKDVNNYLMITEDDEVVTKGAYVKKLTPLDNDLPIINKALVQYMVNGVPLEETIRSGQKLMDYQMITKISNKYQHFIYGDKPLKERVIRVFATTENLPSVSKLHSEGGLESVSNCPPQARIINSNILNDGVPDWLDYDFYIDLAQRRLNHFTGEVEVCGATQRLFENEG